MKKHLKIFALLLTLVFLFSACTDLPIEPVEPSDPIGQPSIPEQPSDPITPIEPEPDEPIEAPFENYGKKVIDIYVAEVKVTKNGKYTSMEQVAVHLYLYHCLPSNYRTKKNFDKKNYTSSNMLSVGGDTFYNREGHLPTASGRTYTECDIDYRGGNRNAKRIVFSSDWLIFYTSDHYSTFSILRFHE